MSFPQTARNSIDIGPVVIFPIITVVCIVLFFMYYRKISLPLPGTMEWIDRNIQKPQFTFLSSRYAMEKKDAAPLTVIIALFAFLALYQLGDTYAPQSFFQFTQERSQITIELDDHETINSLMYYTGLWTGHYTLEFSADGESWLEQGRQGNRDTEESPSPAMNQAHSQLFKWLHAELSADNPPIRYIRVTASRSPIELGEMALFDSNGVLVHRSRITSPGAPELFDEQNLVPEAPTYLNSMYFDEIYHGRTALEHIRRINPYETTHPPLGKSIISASISIFGMTPFGWRFIGAVFGVIMLAVLYILIKNMFGKTFVAVCGTMLLGFDFMRFVQTRIATIDTYGVFFILLSYFFIYRYITTDAEAPLKESLAPLALAGISFGLGCASKWIVPYAAVGLAAIYVIRLVMLGNYYKEEDLPDFSGYLKRTLLWSVLFFVVIPAIIYCMSYIPVGLARGLTIRDGMLWNGEFYRIIWNNQVLMFNYHSGLEAEHVYSSRWWQWILNARPILYYNSFAGGVRSSFGAFGNPVVWWGGFIAMIAMAIRAVKYRDERALFIVIGYLSQLLPWVVVTRVVFIYHYFPSTLFLVLALAHVFDAIVERCQGRYKQAVYGYTAAAGALFFMFYPALSGMSAPHWYFRHLLRWIPQAWPF